MPAHRRRRLTPGWTPITCTKVCTIPTTTANEVMQPIHERMPLILGPSAEEQWLDPRASADALRSLLVLYSSEDREARPVGLWVNNPKNDGPRCLEPAVS
jgi:putative SOS response-associated peptidase YedK